MFTVVLLLILHFIVVVSCYGFEAGLLQQAFMMTMGAAGLIAVLCPPIGIPLYILAYIAGKKRYKAFLKKVDEKEAQKNKSKTLSTMSISCTPKCYLDAE